MRWLQVLLAIGLLLGGLWLRVPTVEQGLQGDERMWLDRAQDLLSQVPALGPVPGYTMGNDLSDRRAVHYDDGRETVTIRAHHPGYLTAVVLAGAMHATLPENPGLEDLIQVRWVQSIFWVASVGVAMAILAGPIGLSAGSTLVVAAFLLSEPMILGESRLIKQDALLLGLLLQAMTCALAFLRTRRVGWLIVSGILLGLASATKLVGLFHLGLWVGFVLWGGAAERRRHLGLVLASAYVAFLLASPPLWLHPLRGPVDALVVASGSSQVGSSGIGVLENAWYFLRTFTHLSPLLLLALVAAMAGVRRSQDGFTSISRSRRWCPCWSSTCPLSRRHATSCPWFRRSWFLRGCTSIPWHLLGAGRSWLGAWR